MTWENPYISSLNLHRDIILSSDHHYDWKKEFQTDELKLHLDIGSGSGNFLTQLAQLHPKNHYIGYELRYKRLVKTSEKLKKRNLDNVRLFQVKAEEKIKDHFNDHSLAGVYVNFPDPWAKSKQKKHRLLQKNFFEQLKALLKKDGFFRFKTDHQSYFDDVLVLMKSQSLFEIVEYSRDLHQSEYSEENVFTEFELLFKGQGLPVYYFKAIPKY